MTWQEQVSAQAQTRILRDEADILHPDLTCVHAQGRTCQDADILQVGWMLKDHQCRGE